MNRLFVLLLISTLCFSAISHEIVSEESDTPFFDSLTPEEKHTLFVNFKKEFLDSFKESVFENDQIKKFGEMLGEYLQRKLEAGDSLGESKYVNFLVLCPVCHGAMRVFNVLFDNWISLQIIELVADKICKHGGMSKSVCHGVVKEFGRKTQKTLATGYFSPQMACSYFMPVCNRPHFKALKYQDYQKEILSNSPASIASNTYITDLYAAIKTDPVPRKTYKLVQISDLHVDPKYEIGTNAQCDEPLCCRKVNGIPTNPANAAQKWGNYNCDIPTVTLDLMLNYIKDEVKPDVIVWTGDNVPHNVWDQSVSENIDATVKVSKQIKELMPDVTVLPVLGNHEAFPVNMYNFEKPHQRLLEKVGDSWKAFIGEAAAKQFKEYGYFEVDLPVHVSRKTRFIGLHSNACNNENFFFLAKGIDPGHHIKWLEERLADAEQNGYTVFMGGHIPSIGCLNEWAFRFRALTERYQHVIRGQYYGHFHKTRTYIARSVKTSQPIGVHYLGGSMTTFTNVNPGFRVYEVDSQTNLPINYKNYYIDLEAANANPDVTPPIQVLYDALEDMGLPDLSPQSWDDYTTKMKNDEQLAMQYTWWSSANSATSKPTSCSTTCRTKLYCMTRNSVDFEERDCLGEPRIDFKNDFQGSFFEVALGPWFQETKKGI